VSRRVAVVLHEPAVGGASLAVLSPIPALERDGWEFCFWAPRPSAVAELLEARGYAVTGEPRELRYSRAALREPPGTWGRMRSLPGYMTRFRRFVATTAPDLVHVNTIVALPEALIARSTGVPTLLHVHEILHGRQGSVAARLARHVDGVAAVSQACAAPLRARGVSVEIVTPCQPEPADLVDRTARETLVVGTLATICERKGSDVFVAAARAILARRPNVEFRMVGPLAPGADAPWARDVVSRAERAGVRWSVTTDPASELRGWDVFVLPTRRDPFPLAVLEAMAAGLPVVASAVDGVPEQVDAASGLLVAPEDTDAFAAAIERLLDDSTLRTDMGRAAAHRIATRFAPARQVAELVAAYERVLASGAARRRRGRAVSSPR
jgi:glycosyltransferase involved in cell wall biosynthesis